MKKQYSFKTLFGAALFALLSQSSLLAQDAHVSLWNFDGGNLSAAAGSDMEYIDDTGDVVAFGTTEALGLPAINGEVANVIQIPKLLPEQGLRAPLPEDSNGLGDLVNNWTAIMDLYYPLTSAGKKRGLIEIITGQWIAGADDAEFYVGSNNAVGTAGYEFGSLTPGEWHRLAIVMKIEDADLGEGWGKIYIDGEFVGGTAVPADSLDGRWSLDTMFQLYVDLFVDDNNESEEVFVNSIQFRFESLNAGQILALGGAAAAGVPEDLPAVPSFVEQWTPTGKYAKSDTVLGAVINPGDTTISNDSISLTLNGETVASEVTSEDGILTVKTSGQNALAKGTKYELVLIYTDSAAGEHTLTRKFEVPVYFEDFDSVELGPNVDELAVALEEAWTRTGPEGWAVDAAGVPGNSEDHVGYLADEDEDGHPDNDGVTEWAGWSFADYDWWVQVAGDQSRSSFTLAQNVVAVADPDEWDDKAHADGAANGWYKTFMTTPEIDVSGIVAGTLFANFHSSWRPEFDGNYHQEGYILASYDGAEAVEIMTWVSDTASPNYHDHNQNEVVILPLNNPDGATKLQLTFGMREAGNDWWWAIDNLVINAGTVPPRIVTQPTSTEINESESFALSVVADGGEPLSYQWYKDGVAIDGATSAEFGIAQASVADGGKYSVKVTNEAGEITSADATVGVQASLGITIWSEDFEGLALGPNVDEGLAGEEVWTKTPPEGWVINDEEVPGTWAWLGFDDEEGHPPNDGTTEWAGWSYANTKWWIQTAGDQRRSEFKKSIGAAAIADGDEWDDGNGPGPREPGNQSTYMTTEAISLDGIMENSLVLRFHSSWRPEVNQTATIEATIDDDDPVEILRWESEAGDAAYYHDHNPNETVNVSINNPAGAKTIKFTFSYLDAGNNWWWAVDNLILAGEPEPIFAENFDSLELDAFESSSESGGDGTDWTATTPTGWVMTRADDHGPVDPTKANVVKEFDGWTFVDPVSWNATAGQDRAEFTKGTGVIAVADSDEYDDLDGAMFNASLSTPTFSLDGVAAGTAILVYDSSWRAEPQHGKVTVSYDGGDAVTLLELTPDSPTAYNETVTLPLGNPEGAKEAVITWDYGSNKNNWWWAIDNIKVTVGKAPAGIVTQLTSVEATEGDGVSFSIKANGDEPLFYKWFKGDTEIAGAEGPVLELSDVSEEDAGSYSVVVSNSAGSATSNPARLAVLLKPGSFLVFTEDFNSLELGPNVDEGVANEAAWTDTPPTGWTVDDSGVPGVDDPATDGVTEWAGWSFANAEWWITAAGDQNRSKFTKATGNAAVADGDEWDDAAHAEGKMSALMSTPEISIAGAEAQKLQLSFDSSWRPYAEQTALITASYDGADAVEVLRWESSAESEFYKSDDSAHWNETLTVGLDNPEGAQNLTLTIGYLTAGNDWWWAIDNIEITGEVQPIFAENFDSLELGPNVDEGVANEAAWTDTPPTGWTVDDSGVPGVGDPATDGVTEWAGWSYANAEWWITTAGDQNRSKFTKATGNAAVADGDEWDDAAHAEGKMSALMSTPEIWIAGSKAQTLQLSFDSSWRPYAEQTALITASYDGADAVEVVRWESNAESEFYKSDDSAHWNETVTVALNNPEGAQKLTLTIGYLTAGNDWWWAIDNVVVYSTAPVELALPANHYFVEDFNSLELGPNVDEGVANAAAWTDTPPTGWTVDDSGVPGVGDPATDGVTEWAGWSFANAEWWITTAGDQNRSKFTKATGNAAVADGDEWDDAAHAEGKMSALMSTPEISIAGAEAQKLQLSFDSSWRPYAEQTALITASYDGADAVEVLRWESSAESEFYKSDDSAHWNETVTVGLDNPEGAQKLTLTIGYLTAGNDWWWAIDNVKVFVGSAPPTIATQPTSVDAVEGDTVTLTAGVEGDQPLTLQWLKDGTAVEGANEATLTIEMVSTADAGSYSLKVTNPHGEATTNNASLAVLLKPGSIVYFSENFDSLELGPFVSDSESGGDGTDWTATGPADWVMALGDDHGPVAGGDDVVEFDGWTFLDPVSWNATAGQNRSEFTKGTGVIAVADSDEYDDKAGAMFNASLSTPAIDIASADAGSLILYYDSSWRAEPQHGKVTVSYDGGDAVTLLELTPDSPTAYNETVTLPLGNPEGAKEAVITWDYGSNKNNWWWAIDNIVVSGEHPPLFAENFDSLELGPFVSDSESGGDGTDWTATAPSGWVVAFGADHGPTAGGDDVVEFDGWTFLDPVSWNATAGQARGEFTKGTGVIAVGDSDEYDDKADAKFNSSLSTPAVDIAGADAGTLYVTYDSSWRKEPQSGTVSVSFDGGDSITLLTLTPDTPTAYNETVTMPLANPEGANTAVITWDHQGYNNWWWAIDNIKVTVGKALPAIATDKESYLSGEDITVNFSNGLGNPKDWVGLYQPHHVPGPDGSTKWLYVSGSTTAGEGLTDGAITFAGGLPAGSYVARFFENDGYTQIADAVAFTVESAAPAVDGLSSLVTGLSTQALESLVAHYDGKNGVKTDGASVVSWTPIDANGDSLDGMIVTSTQRGGAGPELITYDGSGKLTFDDTDVGADGRYLEGALSNAESKELTVFWVGHYSADAPFATSGTYVYNIGINSTSHQRDDGAGGFVVEQYNGTTYAGDDITAYDGVTTVWSTVLTADSHAFYANGTNLNVGGTPSNNVKANAAMLIGAYSSSGYDFVGEVQQLIIFGSALSDADRNLVENYLGAGEDSDTPALSIVNNGDGTVTVTFEGTLQAAPTVNGPWEDVDGASPLTVPVDQAILFGRAVK